MRRRLLVRRIRNGERGAVGVLFGILVTMGVVIGMMALTVDVGNIMYERRQLQNGADATALSLADECARDVDACEPDNANVEPLLDANAPSDDLAQYDSRDYAPEGACGRPPVPRPAGWALPDCPSSDTSNPQDIANLSLCPPLPTWLAVAGSEIPYVETYARTESTEADDTLLPAYFSQALVGPTDRASVSACARAAWGPLAAGRPTLPIVIGQCNWNIATHNGSQLMESPPYLPAPRTGSEVPALKTTEGVLVDRADFITQIFGHVNPSEDLSKFPCNPEIDDGPGLYGPGGFGWLKTCGEWANDPAAPPECEDAPSECHAPVSASDPATGSSGGSTPNPCMWVLESFVGQEVDIPVVTAVTGTGSNLTYTVDGLSSFFLAGYVNVANAHPSEAAAYLDTVPAYAQSTCIESLDPTTEHYKSTCIWGWFTSPVRSGGSIDPDATARGPVTIVPAG